MFIFAFGLGGGVICICKKFGLVTSSAIMTWDMCVVVDLLLLNVYAEYFSLLYKVAGIALLLLMIIIIPLLGLMIKDKWINSMFRGAIYKSDFLFYVYSL